MSREHRSYTNVTCDVCRSYGADGAQSDDSLRSSGWFPLTEINKHVCPECYKRFKEVEALDVENGAAQRARPGASLGAGAQEKAAIPCPHCPGSALQTKNGIFGLCEVCESLFVLRDLPTCDQCEEPAAKRDIFGQLFCVGHAARAVCTTFDGATATGEAPGRGVVDGSPHAGQKGASNVVKP